MIFLSHFLPISSRNIPWSYCIAVYSSEDCCWGHRRTPQHYFFLPAIQPPYIYMCVYVSIACFAAWSISQTPVPAISYSCCSISYHIVYQVSELKSVAGIHSIPGSYKPDSSCVPCGQGDAGHRSPWVETKLPNHTLDLLRVKKLRVLSIQPIYMFSYVVFGHVLLQTTRW